MKKNLLFFIPAMFVLVGCSLFMQESTSSDSDNNTTSYYESEPNDTMNTATSISTNEIVYNANVDYADLDYYSFYGTAGTTYYVTITWISGSSLDLVFGFLDQYGYYIYDSYGYYYIDENWDGEGEMGWLTVGDTSQTFYIWVQDYDFSNTGSYTIRVSTSSYYGNDAVTDIDGGNSITIPIGPKLNSGSGIPGGNLGQ